MNHDEARELLNELAPLVNDTTVFWQGERLEQAIKALVLLHSNAQDDVNEVYEAWAATVKAAGIRKPQLTDGRRTKIRARLDEYGLDAVLAAVTGWQYSSWHRGENPDGKRYYDLDLLLRNGENVERFGEYTRAALAEQSFGSGRCRVCGDPEHEVEECPYA